MLGPEHVPSKGVAQKGCGTSITEDTQISDTLTGPRPEQPDLVRPVLSRELHCRFPEVSCNLNYSVPLAML